MINDLFEPPPTWWEIIKMIFNRTGPMTRESQDSINV